jgi:hypothetical protein
VGASRPWDHCRVGRLVKQLVSTMVFIPGTHPLGREYRDLRSGSGTSVVAANHWKLLGCHVSE